MSLPARGAWVDTGSAEPRRSVAHRRSPQGERGLKPAFDGVALLPGWESLPARGAWVETDGSTRRSGSSGVAPRKGGRGLKPRADGGRIGGRRRSPQGERGLKPLGRVQGHRRLPSLPARGAWVETTGTPVSTATWTSRSPQGERGLKQAPYPGHGGLRGRSPRRGSVG